MLCIPDYLTCGQIIGQRLRNYVANGNMLILTGGIMATEFINTYFFYNIEVSLRHVLLRSFLISAVSYRLVEPLAGSNDSILGFAC